MPTDTDINSSLGSQAGNDYPVGYKPSVFRAVMPNGTVVEQPAPLTAPPPIFLPTQSDRK